MALYWGEKPFSMKINKYLIFLAAFILVFACNLKDTSQPFKDQYNIVWDTQSINSSESMPLVGGDIGCNVWVENGDILWYLQRSGSLDENGEYLKMGRFRLKLNPNPFKGETSFRQELKLTEGYIEIESNKKEGSSTETALLKLWVDVFNPVEKGVMANGAIAYHWESQVEHAYMILEYHRFTGADISKYIPFIEQSLIFFDEHYRTRQKMRDGNEWDENGKLVIYPSTSCESYRGDKNPSDVIAGLRACLTSLLELDEKYLSAERKEYYRGFQAACAG